MLTCLTSETAVLNCFYQVFTSNLAGQELLVRNSSNQFARGDQIKEKALLTMLTVTE